MYITELDFLPFLNASSEQKWMKTKIYKLEYRPGNIMQWFCRAIKLCIISVKIYAAIMMKVTFEIKTIFSLNKVKKGFTDHTSDFFLAMQVIGNEKLFKVGLLTEKTFLLINFCC